VTVTIEAACTACGACLVTCPTGALVAAPFRPVVSEPECVDCLACIEVCPVDAIRWSGLRGGGGVGIQP
jgi:ferredoxin